MDSVAVNTSRKPSVVIRPIKGLLQLDLKSVWQGRELLYFFVWRDVMVRYKQTAVGVAWAVLQPLITVLIFTLIFGNLAKIPSDGVPYPVFAFAGLMPWMYFSQALSRASVSVVGNANLVTKVYFPRLLIPLSAAVAPVVDLFFTFVVLLGLMAWYQIVPGWGMLIIPFLLGLAVMTALAVGLWLSALNVRYRDVGHLVPFLIQIWMYASPVIYPVSMVPEKWRALYGLNPMVGVIEGFRWAMLGKEMPDFKLMAVTSVVVITILLGGLIYFKRTEQTFSDVI